MADRWAQWLRTRRTGGSEEARRATLQLLSPVRDSVLEDADLKPGDVLLDVGCGDGLIGLGALDRGARVIFSDISEDCLDDCRSIAGDEAEYQLAAATDLGDVVADVVTTRSVLIYVPDKRKAFAEFFRSCGLVGASRSSNRSTVSAWKTGGRATGFVPWKASRA